MQAFMSAVHGVMDLEVGFVWRNYGDIYYLTEEQMCQPSVQHAIKRKWLILVSDAEVRYASMDPRKVVGPKPSSHIKPLNTVVPLKSDSNLDALKSDIAKMNTDIQSIVASINSIVGILSNGVPVQNVTNLEVSKEKQILSADPSSKEEEMFIPIFKIKEGISIKTDSEVVQDSSADKAIEELKKIRKKKNGQEN